jgi:hypothetical protein
MCAVLIAMWALENRTPYRAGKTWARDKDGVHEWVVAVKATYDVYPNGQVKLADDQVDVLRVPEYNGEPGASSLRYDADLVSMKPTTDIVLNGTAYSPGGRPRTQFEVSMRIGSIQKSLKVKGNRRWQRGPFGLVESSMEPVARVPIAYERAYGGYDRFGVDPRDHRMDSRNPVGCGVVAPGSSGVGRPLPNLEYPTGNLERVGPAGFGAIDSFWSPRRELTGTYDERWSKSRKPLLPEDWDPRSLLCSPADQQPATYLRGGETVELFNLTPDGTLRFGLPKVHLAFRTDIHRRVEEHHARLTMVVIEPDVPRLMMTWLTCLACRTDIDYLERTIITEKPFIR